MTVHCHECGGPFEIIGYERALLRPRLLCPQCFYDLNGEDPERAERERRDALGGAESPQEETEA